MQGLSLQKLNKDNLQRTKKTKETVDMLKLRQISGLRFWRLFKLTSHLYFLPPQHDLLSVRLQNIVSELQCSAVSDQSVLFPSQILLLGAPCVMVLQSSVLAFFDTFSGASQSKSQQNRQIEIMACVLSDYSE